VHKSERDWELGAAMKTPALWSLIVVVSGFMFGLTTVSAIQVAYLSGEVGMDVRVAATALGFMVGVSIVGRLIGGSLGERVEPRLVMGSFLLLQALSVVILLSVHTEAAVFAYVIIFGASYAANIALLSVVIANYFGVKNFASIQGMVAMAGNLVAATGPVIAGIIKDTTGTFTSAFYLVAAIAVVGALCAFLARPPLSESTGTEADGNLSLR
jgi:MFS transporter, OFA family, oxalate/formate antiporter